MLTHTKSILRDNQRHTIRSAINDKTLLRISQPEASNLTEGIWQRLAFLSPNQVNDLLSFARAVL